MEHYYCMEHYYSEKQTSKLRIKELDVRLRGKILKFCTGSGVFSLGKIDNGTKLLIENCIIGPGWRILDIGSGFGAVGIAAAKAFPSAFVLMADINERALNLGRVNIRLNKAGNISLRKSDVYSNIQERFNTILTNPPQRAGKKVCFEIIEKAKEHLEKGGMLQLVARHNKGGIELAKRMKKVFGNVREIAKKGGYRLYTSVLECQETGS